MFRLAQKSGLALQKKAWRRPLTLPRTFSLQAFWDLSAIFFLFSLDNILADIPFGKIEKI